ncbi:MAG: prepilin-type N-terminal cleavage/methylation domain-containing protein [Rhodospirillaceae bacterium]|nr:prepilin-type N-terminal cleavage/methylation domain-containing protein [Rhodospirillaceae bacterium]
MLPAVRPRRFQRGFSAIEVTIAIVILGIVFMLVLKGAIAVQAMRALLTAYRIQDLQTAVNLYGAELRALPGDDPGAPARYGRPEARVIIDGTPEFLSGNARIDGLLTDTLNSNAETYMAWRDLRYAGFVEGDPGLAGDQAPPENLFGGIYGFDQGNLGQEAGSLCLTKVPGYAAELIDKKLDDGIIDKGKVVATSRFSIDQHNHFSAPDTAGYDVKKTYIICVALRP